jgi:hypothetical protein
MLHISIAYYDGREKGGTYYTVKKARARGIPIINVYMNLNGTSMNELFDTIIVFFRLPSFLLPSWKYGGMEMNETISEETDSNLDI